MATAKTTYLQELRTENIHVQSGSIVITDAPTDNHGKGLNFSPTDLCALSLTNCIITTIGIYAQRNEFNLKSCKAETTKTMESKPRRIAKIEVNIEIDIPMADATLKTIIERVAKTCPVGRSLHPEIVQEVVFSWK